MGRQGPQYGAAMRVIIALSSLLMLGGCGEKELAACVSSGEQTTLLRQIAAAGGVKKNFEACINSNMGEKYCRVIWLDSDTAVHDCMKAHGLEYMPSQVSGGPCHLLDYDDVYCYRPKWLLALPKEIQAVLAPARPNGA